MSTPELVDFVAGLPKAELHSVPHAGESTGPQSIWDSTTDLGAAADLLDLDEVGIAYPATHSVRSSFLDAAGAARILAETDAYVGAS